MLLGILFHYTGNVNLSYNILEPTNNVQPKKVGAEFGGWRVSSINIGSIAWLTCQVTGFPVPRFA